MRRHLRHRRAWFQADDGTFYRNCPLIMAERKRAVARPRLSRELAEEWREAWCEGLLRKATLGRRDYVVQPVPFRVAYPDHPALWALDDTPTPHTPDPSDPLT